MTEKERYKLYISTFVLLNARSDFYYWFKSKFEQVDAGNILHHPWDGLLYAVINTPFRKIEFINYFKALVISGRIKERFYKKMCSDYVDILSGDIDALERKTRAEIMKIFFSIA